MLEKVPLVPPVRMMSSVVKPVTSSEKLNVKVISPLAVPLVLSLMVRVGGAVSNICVACDAAVLLLPVESVATEASISTVIIPFDSEVGVTTWV